MAPPKREGKEKRLPYSLGGGGKIFDGKKVGCGAVCARGKGKKKEKAFRTYYYDRRRIHRGGEKKNYICGKLELLVDSQGEKKGCRK